VSERWIARSHPPYMQNFLMVWKQPFYEKELSHSEKKGDLQNLFGGFAKLLFSRAVNRRALLVIYTKEYLNDFSILSLSYHFERHHPTNFRRSNE
jgi:hypothetical protein